MLIGPTIKTLWLEKISSLSEELDFTASARSVISVNASLDFDALLRHKWFMRVCTGLMGLRIGTSGWLL
jgi:hypothetical protein